MKGTGNQLDYGARIYDPRVGKFLSVDPLTKQYPWLSPFQYAENSPIANIDLDGLESSYAADGRVIFGPYVKDPATGGKLYSTKTPSSIFTYNIDQSKSSVAAKPVAKPKLNKSDNLQVPAQIVKAKQMAERALEPTSLKAYAEHMAKMPQAQISAPNPRAGFSDFEYGMITSPATHASIGMMVPGYNFTLGGVTTYQGIRSENYLQAGLGALGMVGGGFELYGRFGSGSAGRQLAEMEAASGGHFVSRHGAQTSLSSQYMRAISGRTPEGAVLGEVNASRFLSNELQLEAVNMAKSQFDATGKTSFSFDVGKLVGEGYLKGGGAGSYRTTTQVQAVFKDGKLNTLYPLIKQ